MRSCTSCRPCWPPGPAPARSADNLSTPRPERRPNEALLAAATGAWIVVWGRGRRHPAPAEGAHLGRRGHTPVVAVSGRGGSRWPRWSVTGPAAGAGCSTGLECTAAAPASGAASRKEDYAALIAAAHAPQLTQGRVAGGIAAPGSHRSRRDSLPSPGSSHPPPQPLVPHAQCRNPRGWLAASSASLAWAAGVRSSRRYLLRIQRTR